MFPLFCVRLLGIAFSLSSVSAASADEITETPNLGVIDDGIVLAEPVSLEPTPVPVEYDIRQFAFQAASVKWDLLAFGTGILALGVTRWDWGTSGFHFVSEDWSGR